MVIVLCLIVGTVVHLPLFTKSILTADVLLNTGYYSGYAWEISLGRFGLYLVGLLKGFLVIPAVEIFLSMLFVIGSVLLLLELFEIKNKLLQVLVGILVMVSPVISATFLFHYCSLAYCLAFFSEILAVVLLVKGKNRFIQYGLPPCLILLSLSMYQAYLAVGLTLLLLWWMISILKKEFCFKKFLLSFGIVFVGCIGYFLLMKLSLVVFHVDLSSYRGASQFGVSTLFEIPKRILVAYQSFYQFYFTDSIVHNSNLFLQLWNGCFFGFLFVRILLTLYQKRIALFHVFFFFLCLFLLPIPINFMSILFADTQMQLLMSSAYLLLFFFLIAFIPNKRSLIIFVSLLFLVFIRSYIIQDNATYQTLENTYQKTYQVAEDIRRSIQDFGIDKKILIVGNLNDNRYYRQKSNTELGMIPKKTYGFVSHYSLFWEEYGNRKNGWSRFFEQELGTSITFASALEEEKIIGSKKYQKMACYPSKDGIQLIDDIIVVKLAK